MRLDQASWYEVDAYLQHSKGILIPCGSTEQHGPIGLIGTDALCAQMVGEGVAKQVNAYVAPTLAYTPAPFNIDFPGTMSVSAEVLQQLVGELIDGLLKQGFETVYFINGHGANLQPLQQAASQFASSSTRIRSWWDFEKVNKLRQQYYGDWEGMHATPSEIAITRVSQRVLHSNLAQQPPQKLSQDYIRQHAGDLHGPPHQHREQFPDGRVGSHSALARTEHGRALLRAAVESVARDFVAACQDESKPQIM